LRLSLCCRDDWGQGGSLTRSRLITASGSVLGSLASVALSPVRLRISVSAQATCRRPEAPMRFVFPLDRGSAHIDERPRGHLPRPAPPPGRRPPRWLGDKRSGSKPVYEISETDLTSSPAFGSGSIVNILYSSNKPGLCICQATGPALPVEGVLEN